MALPRDIQKLIQKESSKFLQRDFEKIATERFNKLKLQMIAEFMAHPVTQEIMAGPQSANISGTLGGKGNLFAFIGFEEGDNPTQPILEILESVKIVFNGNIDSGSRFLINFPDTKEVFSVTPMPWAEGRSWAKGIESGISGLGYFIYKANAASRSGEGSQTSVKLNSGARFKNTAYMSSLLSKYRNLFLKLDA